MNNRRLLVGTGAAAVGLLMALPALSQTSADASTSSTNDSGTLQEVTVTAERRAEDEQKAAVSVAVRNGDDLIREGKSTMAQMLEDVPGVIVPAAVGVNTPTDNPGGAIVIRGIAPAVVLPGDTGVATTALYTDGVYGGIGADFDVDRLEVLRGPQGTLYGRSATSGVVSTYTRDPELGKWNSDANLEYGSYALQHVSGAVNIPVGDDWAVRISGNDLYQNGYLDGINSKGGSHQEDVGRVKVLYQPNQDLSLLLGFAVQGDTVGENGPAATLTGPNSWSIAAAPGGAPDFTDTFRQYWAHLTWNLGFGMLTYQPALRTYSSDSGTVLNAIPVFLQDISNNFRLDQIHTEELRLASNSESAISWIAGAWLYDRLYDYDETVFWEPSGGFSHEPHIVKSTVNGALFGEAAFPFADSWRLTTGVRIDHTRINSQNSTYTFNTNEGTCNGAGFSPGVCVPYGGTESNEWSLPNALSSYTVPPGTGIRTQNNFTYKARIEKDLTVSKMLYAMASSGFLPGDLSLAQSRDPSTGQMGLVAFNYSAETLHSYELGSKNRFLDNTVQINAAAFYYDYSGYQQFINLNPGRNPYFVVTTSPARMYGFELETLWQISVNDRLGLSAGYTNARYVNKPTLFSTYVAQDEIPGVIPLTLQGRYDHRFPLPNGSSVNAGADFLFSSSYDEGALAQSEYTGLEPYVHLGSEITGNARLTWMSPSGRFSVTGYVRNLSNNIYKLAATDTLGINTSAPRVYGVVLHATVE